MYYDSMKQNIYRIWRLPVKAGIYPVIAWFLILLIIIQLVRMIWLIIAPIGPLGDWKANAAQSISNDRRGEIFATVDPFSSQKIDTDSQVVTSLDLLLHGTTMNEISGGGSAIISGADGVQNSYAVGDEIIDGAILDSVAFDHIIIDRSGAKESLFLDQSIPAKNVAPSNTDAANSVNNDNLGPAKITSASIQRGISFQPRNIDQQITGIIVSPNVNSDPTGQIFAEAGFLQGDIITSINGNKIRSAADIAALQSQITPGARLSIMVERGADVIPVSLNLEE